MSTVSGQGTTFNLPNYVGDLFAVTPTDTKFLSAIGGLTGGIAVDSYVHTWQTYDLRAAAQNVALEGANAPTAQERDRSVVRNVAQIIHEAVEISYTKLATSGQYASTGAGNTNAVGIAGMNPVGNELDWQVEQALKQIARDTEWSFINGTFSDPANNSTTRRTRGILSAISTNTVANAGAPFTRNTFYTLLDLMFESGAENDGSLTVMANSDVTLRLNNEFIENVGRSGYMQTDRNIGGVNLQTIVTPFGELNVMMNRHMPTDQLAVVKLSDCAPFFVEVPNKGFLFAEPLAKVGSAERVQIYGEIGLAYGNELQHGKITGIPAGYGYDS